MHQTAISNDPCEFIYRFRHTLDTLLSTHGHSIQNNVVYVNNCYFKFEKKTRDHLLFQYDMTLSYFLGYLLDCSEICKTYNVFYMVIGPSVTKSFSFVIKTPYLLKNEFFS